MDKFLLSQNPYDTKSPIYILHTQFPRGLIEAIHLNTRLADSVTEEIQETFEEKIRDKPDTGWWQFILRQQYEGETEGDELFHEYYHLLPVAWEWFFAFRKKQWDDDWDVI